MRRKIVRVKSLDRKKVFADLFEKLSRAGEKRQ
jgi:hypothetical protein